MKLVDSKLGAEGKVTVDLVGGILQAKVTEDTPGFKASLEVDMPLEYYIEAGATKLNSPFFTAIASMLVGVVKQIP
jgi:hypothetical protein